MMSDCGTFCRDVHAGVPGPSPQEILQPLTALDLSTLACNQIRQARSGSSLLVARTGYTGEDGFELYLPAAGAVTVWRRHSGGRRAAGPAAHRPGRTRLAAL